MYYYQNPHSTTWKSVITKIIKHLSNASDDSLWTCFTINFKLKLGKKMCYYLFIVIKFSCNLEFKNNIGGAYFYFTSQKLVPTANRIFIFFTGNKFVPVEIT